MERPVLRELWNSSNSIRNGELLLFQGIRRGKCNDGGNPRIENVYYYDQRNNIWIYATDHVYLDIHSSIMDQETFEIFKPLMNKGMREKMIKFYAYIRPYGGFSKGIGLCAKPGSTWTFI